MQNMNPIGRAENLVVQEYGNDVLVYDLVDHRAMSLNETSARVWRACDGQKSVGEIAAQIGDEGVTLLALSELKKAKLVDAKTPELAKFEGMPRREAIRRIGMSSLIALPIIASLATPALAQGTCPPGSNCTANTNRCPNCPCNGNGQCASGNCQGGTCA